MKRFTEKLLLFLALAAFAPAAFAQDVPPPPGGESKEDAELRAKIKERIIAKILERKHEKVREILKLDDDQAKKFFAMYLPAEKDLVDLVRRKDEQGMKLLALTQGDYTDADVDPTLVRIKELDAQIVSRADKLNDDLKPVLTPRQRARLLVFEHEFNRRVREEIRERRERWRDRHPDDRPPHRPGGPDNRPRRR